MLLESSYLLFLDDVVGQHLGRVEELNGRLVLENVAFGRRQRVENLVLDLFQLFLVVGAGHDQSLSFGLQLRPDDTCCAFLLCSPVLVRSIAMSVSVCPLHISKTPCPNFTKFSAHAVAAARSFFGDSAVRYVTYFRFCR